MEMSFRRDIKRSNHFFMVRVCSVISKLSQKTKAKCGKTVLKKQCANIFSECFKIQFVFGEYFLKDGTDLNSIRRRKISPYVIACWDLINNCLKV